jgi:hypothetical protein
MNKNTKDTAAQIQRAADAMTQTLQVLQADRADRLAQLNKKPEFAINVGRVPILKAHATLTPTQETDTSVTYHLDLWNRGDVTANKLYFRALVSAKDVTAFSNPASARSPTPPTAPFKPSSLRTSSSGHTATCRLNHLLLSEGTPAIPSHL